MNVLAPLPPRHAARRLSRIDRVLVGALLRDGRADVVTLAGRTGLPVFDLARAAYGLARVGLARVTETERAAVRRVDPAPCLSDLPVATRGRCLAAFITAASRQAVRS